MIIAVTIIIIIILIGIFVTLWIYMSYCFDTRSGMFESGVFESMKYRERIKQLENRVSKIEEAIGK